MDGVEFERLVAERMRGLGWSSRLTPGSGDFGADVICELESERLVIQCKCYADLSSVGADAVREVYAAIRHFDAQHGLVVYRGRPTRNAMLLARSTCVELFHIDELAPGWSFDRTARGAEIRKQRALQEARERRENYLQQERAYKAACIDYAHASQSWVQAANAHQYWKSGGVLLLIIAVAVFFGGAHGWGLLLLLASGYCYFGTSPGLRPPEPIKPVAPADDPSPASRPAPTSAPTRPEPTAREPVASKPARSKIASASSPARTGRISGRNFERVRPTAFARELDAAIQALRSEGYQVEQRHGSWRVYRHGGSIKRLNSEGLIELSKGLTRVRCSGCRVQLRVAADRRLKVLCPRCGTSAIYQS